MNARVDTVPVHTEIHASKALNAGLWVSQVMLAAAFGMAGAMKITTPIATLSQNMNWVADLPLLVRFIGAAELAGALGMLLPSLTRIQPRLTALAGAGLTLVMVLASGFHVMRGEFGALPITFVLGGLAAFVAWGRYRSAPIASR